MDEETATKSRFDKYSTEKLLDHLKDIFVKFSQEPTAGYLKNEMKYITSLLIEKRGKTQNEIKDFLDSPTDKEIIHNKFSNTVYDPYENIEYKKPDY